VINFFSNQTKTITGAAIILGAASFISRLIGIIRDRIFAHMFGAGAELDVYYAAFRIPDLVYNLVIVGAISAGFIPVFTKLLSKNKKEAWLITNGIINLLGIIIIALTLILYYFAPQIISILVPGFTDAQLANTIMLTRIMFLSPLILGLSSIVSGVLQSFKCFLIYALTPILYNFGIIIGAIYLVPHYGLKGLAYGVVIGALLHLVIQLPSFFKYGFKYEFVLPFQNKNLREIIGTMLPRTLGLATTQLNLVAITILASTIGTGSVAIFNLANNIQHFPIGIIGISFAIAAFPTLSELAGQNKIDKLIENLTHTIRQIIFFIIPLTIIFLLLRAQIVRVLLGSGNFTWSDTIITSNTLAFFTLSLAAQSLIPLFIRAFFALKDTWTPFLIGIISSLINIIFGIYLKEKLGISGLALAFSFSMTVQVAFLWFLLRQKIGSFNESNMLYSLNKISVAAIIMAIFIQLIKTPLAYMVDMTKLWGIMTQGMVAGISGLIIYSIICKLLNLEEMNQFQASLKHKFIKLGNVTRGEITEADEI